MATVEERLLLIEKRLEDLEYSEAPLTLLRHTWESAVKPVAGAVAWGAKKVAPYAITAVITLMAVGQLAIPGCHLPTPDPVPVVPVVPPAPVIKSKLFISVLYDANMDNRAMTTVATDKGMRDQLSQAGHIFRLYEKTQDEFTKLGFGPFALKAGNFPCVIFQLPDGTVKNAIPMPASVADFQKAVTQAGGL